MSQKIGYERRRKGEIVCWTGGEVGEMWYVANEQMDSGRAVGVAGFAVYVFVIIS